MVLIKWVGLGTLFKLNVDRDMKLISLLKMFSFAITIRNHNENREHLFILYFHCLAFFKKDPTSASFVNHLRRISLSVNMKKDENPRISVLIPKKNKYQSISKFESIKIFHKGVRFYFLIGLSFTEHSQIAVHQGKLEVSSNFL